MHRQLTLFLAAVLAFFLIMNCTGCYSYTAGLKEFSIEEKGMIIYNSPRGYQELDLDAGMTRDVFDGRAGDTPLHYRTGWRRDVIWRISHTGALSLDVVSPYSGTVERCSLFDEKNNQFDDVYGSISDDTVLVTIKAGKKAEDERHACFFNTFTREVEEFWKSPELAAEPLSISPYGDIVTLAVRPKKQSKEETLNRAVWVYDCRQKKLTNLTENLKLPPDVVKYIRFSDVQVSPVTRKVLLPTTRRYKKDGRSLRAEDLWVYDPRTKEAHKIEIGTKGYNVWLLKGYAFAPDGKRAIIAEDSFFIYDTSTQIIAPVPNTPKIDNSAC